MTAKATKKPHHHGDLRNALVRAGIEILSEQGHESLSLRQCAARAGVSHAAPAHHFGSVAGLRTAIADEGFRRFRLSMLDALDRAGPGPHERLRAICAGYVDFARDNRALFGLIFTCDAADLRDKRLGRNSSAAYQVLRDICAPFQPPGQDPEIIEAQVWSLVHGYSALYLTGQFGPVDPTPGARGPFDRVIALLDALPLARKA